MIRVMLWNFPKDRDADAVEGHSLCIVVAGIALALQPVLVQLADRGVDGICGLVVCLGGGWVAALTVRALVRAGRGHRMGLLRRLWAWIVAALLVGSWGYYEMDRRQHARFVEYERDRFQFERASRTSVRQGPSRASP